MFDRTDKLVEATMLALQGKLELKESRASRKAKTKKTESIDVNVDETTSVSVNDNTTIVDTADATIIIEEPKESIEEPVADVPVDTVEVPVDDTVMPEEIIDTPVETELPTETEPTIDEMVEESKKVTEDKKSEIYDELSRVLTDYEGNGDPELRDDPKPLYNMLVKIQNDWEDVITSDLNESKKVENVEIEVSDDGKEIEVTTDDHEEVEVKDETPDEEEKPDEDITDLKDDGNENIEGEEIIDDQLIDESKKDESIGALLGEEKVEEDTNVALEPRYDSRNSFYGKARVVTKDNGDEELYSYGTLVAGIKDGKPYSKGKFSQTTSRHQREFFKQRDIDPATVEVVEEGKECKNCKECDNKLEAFRAKSRELRHARIQEMLSKKTESKDEVKDVNDLGIVEGVPDKEEAVPNTEEAKIKVESKFSSKSFNEALTTYLKSQYKIVENVEVTKLAQNKTGDIKIEAVVHNITKRDRNICLEMHKVQEGRTFNKYTLKDAVGLIKESKDTDTKLNMVTFTNKQNVLECRYFIKK